MNGTFSFFSKKTFLFGLFFLTIFISPSVSFAAQTACSWTKTTSGGWFDSTANWSCGAFPNDNTYDVTICNASAGANITVSATTSVTVGRLTVGSPGGTTTSCNSRTHTLAMLLGSTLTVNDDDGWGASGGGDLRIGGRGTFNAGLGTNTIDGDMSVNESPAGSSATFTASTSTMYFPQGGSDIYTTNYNLTFWSLNVAPSGATTTMQSDVASQVTVTKTLTLNGGGFTLSDTSIDVPTLYLGTSTPLTVTSGVPYIYFDTTSRGCSTASALNTYSIGPAVFANTLTLGAMSVTCNATTTLSGNISVYGTLYIIGALSSTLRQEVVTDGYNLSVGGLQFGGAGIVFDPTLLRLTKGSTLTVNGNIGTQTGAGSGNAAYTIAGLQVENGNTINVAGNFDMDDEGSGGASLPFFAGTSTVTFTGTAAQTIDLQSGTSFYNVTLNNSASDGSNSVILSDNLDVDNTLTLTDGALDLLTNAKNLNIGGDLTINSSASSSILRSNNGTTTFDGTTVYTDNSGSFQMGNIFIASSTAAASLTLQRSATSSYVHIGSGETLSLTRNNGSFTLALNNSATSTPLVVLGTLTTGTGTVAYKGTTATTIAGGISYYKLNLIQSGTTFTLGGNATTTSNFAAYTGSTFVSGSNTLEVGGIYTASSTETWTGGTLFLNSGTYSGIAGTHTFNILQIGASTTIKMDGSSASTYTVDSKGALYSTDHAGVNGDLYIWGNYRVPLATTATTSPGSSHSTYNIDYWSYATDFNGTSLAGGSERQVHVYIAPGASVSVDHTRDAHGPRRLKIIGTATYPTVITRQGGSGNYTFKVNGGRLSVDQAQFNYLDTSGVQLLNGGIIDQLDNTVFDNIQSGGSYITISNATTTLVATSTTFNNTSSAATYNVNASGGGVSWVFKNSAGTFDGDSYDNETSNASVLWDDSTVSTTTPTASATSIQWNFTDNAGSEKGYNLFDTAGVIKKSPSIIYNYATGTAITMALFGDSLTVSVTSQFDILDDNGVGHGPILKRLIENATGKIVRQYSSGAPGMHSFDFTTTGPYTLGYNLLPPALYNARLSANLNETPDITIMLLGTNDSGNPTSGSDYETYMRDIVSVLTATGTTPLLTGVPPYYYDDELFFDSSITDYNTRLTTIAADSTALPRPDIYNAFAGAYFPAYGQYYFTYDGVHVNETGYQILANELMNTLMLNSGNISATPNLSSITETGLTPNTQYQRVIYPMNAAGNAGPATTTAVYTLAAVPASASASVSGSTIVVTWDANSNPGTTEYYVADTTDGTNSGWTTATTYTFSSPSTTGTHTITVKARNAESTETTTTSTTVSYGSSGSSGGGGGSSSGGGGGISGSYGTVNIPAITNTTAPSVTTTAPTQTTSSGSNSALPSRIVEPYSTSNDVTILQGLLATDPSIYPEGKITGYYGALTIKAVQNFQKKYGIISSGTLASGFGRVGPKTLAKLREVYGQSATEPSKIITPAQTTQPTTLPTTTGTLTGPFLMFGTSEQNKILQIYLAKDPTIYPEGQVTGYYGALTKKAVGRFQEKYNITKPGDEFYGYAGPNTRAKIVEVLGT